MLATHRVEGHTNQPLRSDSMPRQILRAGTEYGDKIESARLIMRAQVGESTSIASECLRAAMTEKNKRVIDLSVKVLISAIFVFVAVSVAIWFAVKDLG